MLVDDFNIQFVINNSPIHSQKKYHLHAILIFNMMKYILLATLVAVVVAYPAEIEIVSSSNDNEGTGNYHWGYKTSDGAEQDAVGSLRANSDPKAEFPQFQVVEGSYKVPGDNGKSQTVTTYTADDKGYKSKTVYIARR